MIVTVCRSSGRGIGAWGLANLLSSWNCRTLYVDWNPAGDTAGGLESLVEDQVAGVHRPMSSYTRQPEPSLTTLALGGGRLSRLDDHGWQDWCRQQDVARALDRCADRWRRAFDMVVLDGRADVGPARFAYLVLMPEVLVLRDVGDPASLVALLHQLDDARDRSVTAPGRLLVVPIPTESEVYDSESLSATFGPWLAAWIPARVAMRAVLDAVAVDDATVDSWAPLAALLVHDLAGLASLIDNPDYYLRAARDRAGARHRLIRDLTALRQRALPERNWAAVLDVLPIAPPLPETLELAALDRLAHDLVGVRSFVSTGPDVPPSDTVRRLLTEFLQVLRDDGASE